MEQFFENHGLLHIGQNFLDHLEHNSLLNCRAVNWKWNRIFDHPKIWLKKLGQKGFSKYEQERWEEIVKNTEDENVCQNISFFLMRLHQDAPK